MEELVRGSLRRSGSLLPVGLCPFVRGSVFIFYFFVKHLGLSFLILSHIIIALEPKDFLSFGPTELSSLVKKHEELEPVSYSLLRLGKMEPQM